ncbi:hypothetical protein FRB95_008998 [Tulasnella sp. JGI-2019a]|nr:hypothetical protein FRB95_008998 [Tulasnella sp. JGI-2019a]
MFKRVTSTLSSRTTSDFCYVLLATTIVHPITHIFESRVNQRRRRSMPDSSRVSDAPETLDSVMDDVVSNLSRLTHAPNSKNSDPNQSPSPINQLPTEDIVEIFVLALRANIQDYHRTLHTLSCVCSSWRNIVQDSPRLWSFIFNRQSWRTIKTALFNSRDYPLDITCYTSDGEIQSLDSGSSSDEPDTGRQELSGSERRENRFLQEMFHHLPRWRYVWLGSSSVEKCAPLMVVNPAPLLERFGLALSHGAFSRTPPINLFGGERPPRLKELELRRVAIPWDSNVLSNLTSLSLHGILQGGPTVPQVLEILRRCPMLQRFEMNLVERQGEKAIAIVEPTTIHLSHLTDLIMLSTSRYMTVTILSKLRAAANRIEVSIQSGQQLLIDRLVEFILPALKLSLAQPEARIHVYSTLIEMVVDVMVGKNTTPAFHLRVIGGGSATMLDSNDLQEVLNTHMTPITIWFKAGSGPDSNGNGPHSIAHAKDVLRSFNDTVDCVKLHRSLTSVVIPVLEQLSTTTSDNAGSHPYPKLRGLELIGCKGYAPSDLLDFVERRRALIAGGWGEGMLSIVVSNGSVMDDVTLGKLQDILGEGKIHWIRAA